jgi:1-acyl-sn-glycerol-3-phosphate acyltransferase
MNNPPAYNHTRYERLRRFLRLCFNPLVHALVKFDSIEGVENVPASGPVLLYGNHIHLLDPVVIILALPRNIVPLAKIETYDYPVIGIVPRLWHVIPVRRGEVDRQALRACLDVLEAGEIVWIAPEGTRRPALLEAKDGMAFLAAKTGVPLLPVAVDGTIGFPALPFSRRWKGPGVTLKYGRPFRFKTGPHAGREQLAQMTAEAMYILAALLPPERRGVFSDLSKGTQDTVEWL